MVSYRGNWYSNSFLSYIPGFIIKGEVSIESPKELTKLKNNEVSIIITHTGTYKQGIVEKLKTKVTYEGKNEIKMSIPYGCNNGILNYHLRLIGDELKGTYSLNTPQDTGEVSMKPV